MVSYLLADEISVLIVKLEIIYKLTITRHVKTKVYMELWLIRCMFNKKYEIQ